MDGKRQTSFYLRSVVAAAVLLAVVALASPHEAQAYDWRTVTVDAEADVSNGSITVDANGDPMISYQDGTNDDLKFAICDRSESTGGNCDQPDDWSTVTVDAEGSVPRYLFLALNGSGDPMISYFNSGLKFAICDRSASTNGNCDQPGDWSTVALDSAVST
jgi:hypothetical protein